MKKDAVQHTVFESLKALEGLPVFAGRQAGTYEKPGGRLNLPGPLDPMTITRRAGRAGDSVVINHISDC